MTADSYLAAVESHSQADALISDSNPDARYRGYSRISTWLAEFRGYVEAQRKGGPDSFPAFNIVYLPNDHTNGSRVHMPTPQFYVAENDYALGLFGAGSVFESILERHRHFCSRGRCAERARPRGHAPLARPGNQRLQSTRAHLYTSITAR